MAISAIQTKLADWVDQYYLAVSPKQCQSTTDDGSEQLILQNGVAIYILLLIEFSLLLSSSQTSQTREDKMTFCRKFAVILLTYSLTSCALLPTAQSLESEPNFDYTSHELFGQRPDILAPQMLHRLSAAQYEDFDAYFGSDRNRHTLPHRRVYDYLEGITEKFIYYDETLTARDALEQQHGNCMSLAMLTTALADRAGVSIEYQLMDDRPIFAQGQNVITKGVHVRTKLIRQNPSRQEKILDLLKPGLIIDYFPDEKSRFVGNLKTSQYTSRYYLNKAVVALDENNFNLAYWLVLEAFKLNESSPSAINTLAVIYKRKGAVVKAEEVYLYGIKSLPEPLMLLKNYQILLTEQNRLVEVAAIELKLQKIKDTSPYRWRRLAVMALESGDYREAENHYLRAIKITPYMHDLHYSLARVYSLLGKPKETKHQLELAMNYAQNNKSRSLYQRKLDAYSPNPDN